MAKTTVTTNNFSSIRSGRILPGKCIHRYRPRLTAKNLLSSSIAQTQPFPTNEFDSYPRRFARCNHKACFSFSVLSDVDFRARDSDEVVSQRYFTRRILKNHILTSIDQTRIPPLDTVVRERRASKARYSFLEREISITAQSKESTSPPFGKVYCPLST